MDARIRALAETIWRYHRLNHQLAPADVWPGKDVIVTSPQIQHSRSAGLQACRRARGQP